MSITRILFTAASLIITVALASEAPAGVLGDIMSYVSGDPSAGQTSGNYPQFNGNGGYQYQVTYHGPATNQPASQAAPNANGRYASASPAQGYPQYQPVTPQRTVVPNPGGPVSRTAVYPQASQRRVVVNRNQSAQQIQVRNRTTYRQPSPARQQYFQPYGYSGQPAASYYGSYAPRQRVSTRSSYYSNPYQNSNQGWYSGSSCPTGRT